MKLVRWQRATGAFDGAVFAAPGYWRERTVRGDAGYLNVGNLRLKASYAVAALEGVVKEVYSIGRLHLAGQSLTRRERSNRGNAPVDGNSADRSRRGQARETAVRKRTGLLSALFVTAEQRPAWLSDDNGC